MNAITAEIFAAAGEERRAERFPMLSKMRISWGMAGCRTAPMAVWGLNISEKGAAFVSDEPLPVAASLQLELPRGWMTSNALVRNCTRWGAAWRVGVEFEGRFSRVE